ncbi:hypothetical protein [Actinoplanes sp. NPDC049118]|uniref:hypothetical protein n=1 Tax=Actinoplanes sp. NPDC049118 TaxID=3155769 RepID=UPI0033F3D580
MSSRSHGRPTPSRGARVEQRKATRPAPESTDTTPMRIPDAVRALSTETSPSLNQPWPASPNRQQRRAEQRKRKGARRG